MKDVELIRASALRHLSTALDRIRIHASGIPGNLEAVDALRDEKARALLVRITFDMGEPVKGGACVKVWVA